MADDDEFEANAEELVVLRWVRTLTKSLRKFTLQMECPLLMRVSGPH